MKSVRRLSVLILIYSLVPYFALGSRPGLAQPNYEIIDDTGAQTIADESRTVTLDFKDANLKDVLKVFSQQSGLNFIASKNVEDHKVTLYMENVLVEDALQTLLVANNLGLEQSPGSNIIIVKGKPAPPIETDTRVYKLRYIHGIAAPGSMMLGQQQKSTSRRAAASDGGISPTEVIEPLLTPGIGSVVSFGNIMVITDVPERFKLFDQILGDIDKPIPEVMLEVELIETTADFLQNVGVKWSGEFARYSGPSVATPMPYAGFNDLRPKYLGRTVDADGKVTHVEQFPQVSGLEFNYGIMSSAGLTAILQMLKTDSNTKFLAKPRILVQHQEWAEIKVSANQIVSLKTTVDNQSGTTTTEVERMEVGTVLRLLPLVNDEEGFVSLLLEPSISRPVTSAFSGPDGTRYVDPHYRSLRTVVMIRDKETVAIGGFITTEDSETVTKVPWLGDLPFFGALFRHKSSDRVDKELLIFLTPQIIRPTERLAMWISRAQAAAAEDKPGPAETRPAAAVDEQEAKTPEPVLPSPAAALQKPALGFREQEDFTSLNIDLTIKSPSIGGIDLVK